MVKAIIAEISQDNQADFGFNWASYDPSSGTPLATVDFNGTLSGLLSGIATNGVALPPNGAALGFGNIASSGTGYLALLKAIKGNTSNNILSTPTLVTLDNEEAEIVVGQNVPFVTGSYTSSTSGSSATNPFQTIKREDVGLSLKIKPQINEGNSIRLEISQEVSSVSNSAGTASDLITNKRALKTTVMVDDGTILALGGLVDETVGEIEQKVPFLGDIPFIGWLFKYKKSTKVKRDLTIFLLPHIIRDNQQGHTLSSRKYSLLRAQQLESNERDFSFLGEDNPVMPELKELLELPPPYEPTVEERSEVK
jgi:general secretion pathway protein D